MSLQCPHYQEHVIRTEALNAMQWIKFIHVGRVAKMNYFAVVGVEDSYSLTASVLFYALLQ